MDLHPYTIRKIAKSATSRHIETAAVHLLADKLEALIKDTIQKADALLTAQNLNRVNQGLPQKKRISPELIAEVLSDD